MISGAIAMRGVTCRATAYGPSIWRMIGESPEGIASARPRAEPSAKPATDSHSVAPMSSQTMSLKVRSTNATAMSSGGGRIVSATQSSASASSQTASSKSRKKSGGHSLRARRFGDSADRRLRLNGAPLIRLDVLFAGTLQPPVRAQHELLELALRHHLLNARPLEGHLQHVSDASRARRHHDHTVGQQHRFGDVVSYEEG